MRVSEKVSIFSFVLCLAFSLGILEVEAFAKNQGIILDPNSRILPFALLIVSGLSALWGGFIMPETFTLYKITCRTCGEYHESKHNLKANLWMKFHRLSCKEPSL